MLSTILLILSLVFGSGFDGLVCGEMGSYFPPIAIVLYTFDDMNKI